MKLNAVIFDLDGTLIDSLDDLHITMNRVLNDSGYPLLTKLEVKQLIGNGAREFVRLSLPKNQRSEENIDLHMEKYLKYYDKYGLDNTRPYENIENVLKKLQQNNIKIGILSNKPHDATVYSINKIFPHFNFDAILGQKDIFPPKPDIQSAIYTAKLMNVKPNETAFIGDGDTDVLVALKGDFYQASVTWGYRNKEDLKKTGAQNFLKTPEDILKMFDIM